MTSDVTGVFAEAVREAEKLIANPPFPVSDQDLAALRDFAGAGVPVHEGTPSGAPTVTRST